MPPKPKKQKSLPFEQVYLDSLPSAQMYEKSYMHRDFVTFVAVTPGTDFFITASHDGHLKFWKKRFEGVEFVKHFRAHAGRSSASASAPTAFTAPPSARTGA